MEKYGRAMQATDSNITRSMRIACWVSKAADTHSEYEIPTDFPRQQGLRERFSILRYMKAYIRSSRDQCCGSSAAVR